MLIILVILLLVFGFGGYRLGPGIGYYGGGGGATGGAITTGGGAACVGCGVGAEADGCVCVGIGPEPGRGVSGRSINVVSDEKAAAAGVPAGVDAGALPGTAVVRAGGRALTGTVFSAARRASAD